jgi:hypothetical protein
MKSLRVVALCDERILRAFSITYDHPGDSGSVDLSGCALGVGAAAAHCPNSLMATGAQPGDRYTEIAVNCTAAVQAAPAI